MLSVTEQTHYNMESICFIFYKESEEEKKKTYTNLPRTALLFRICAS